MKIRLIGPPAAAQRGVQVDLGHQLRQPIGDQPLL